MINNMNFFRFYKAQLAEKDLESPVQQGAFFS